MIKYLLAVLTIFALPVHGHATTGKGCLRVVNVASWDTLSIRARPSAASRIVGEIEPRNQGVISLRGACVPKSISWGSRWCPVTYYQDSSRVRGWVKARFVRDSDCP